MKKRVIKENQDRQLRLEAERRENILRQDLTEFSMDITVMDSVADESVL